MPNELGTYILGETKLLLRYYEANKIAKTVKNCMRPWQREKILSLPASEYIMGLTKLSRLLRRPPICEQLRNALEPTGVLEIIKK